MLCFNVVKRGVGEGGLEIIQDSEHVYSEHFYLVYFLWPVYAKTGLHIARINCNFLKTMLNVSMFKSSQLAELPNS